MFRLQLASALLLPAAAAFLLVTGAGAQTDEPKISAEEEGREPSPILAFYDFEESVPSGPSTFWLREREGSVDLSTAFRVRGERSLHLREVAGDRDFSEFLVYFDERSTGAVFVQFYLLLTDPGETLNVGLAGTRWFLNPIRDGHAVWIQSGDGELRHRPAAGFRKLFEPRAFVWYFVDLIYDIDRGRYDLAIYEEGFEEPVADLRGERNFADSEASSVRYFSLIGDLEDLDGFDFFVDDLLIATDPEILQKPFVAPGRRQWFVDLFRSHRPPLDADHRENVLDEARDALDRSFDPLALPADSPRLERLETAADLAFDRRDLDLAQRLYEQLSQRPEMRVRLWLKMADIAHLRGDAERERNLRESIYGRLDLEENR